MKSMKRPFLYSRIYIDQYKSGNREKGRLLSEKG